MQIPKYHETFMPILKVLNEENIISYGDLKREVLSKYYPDLTQEQLSIKLKDGSTLASNRVGWGIAYLKQAKMLHKPTRGMVQITDKGKKILQTGTLSLKDLTNDPDYQAYEAEKKSDKETENKIYDNNATPEDLIDAGFKTLDRKVKEELLDKLKSIDPYEFEKVVLELLDKMGYGEFYETPKSNDGGIDGIINQDDLGLEKIYVQAKRYSENKVRETDIRNFIGAMSSNTNKGIFVTTSSFDQSAIVKAKEAKPKVIILVDGRKLTELMYNHNVGVQTANIYETKIIDEDFFENN